MSLVRHSVCLGLLALGLVAAGSPVHANLITNGSFEAGPATGGITPLGAGTLPGWTLGLSPDNSWYWYMSSTGGYGVAQDGSKFVNVTSPWLEQSFAVNAGTPYLVSYFEALRADGSGTGDTLTTTISLGAGTAAGVTSQVANNPLTNGTALGWVPFTLYFVPDTTTTATLRFSLTAGGIGYPVLDNVAVNAVPEPASLVLFGLGAIGLFLAARRRLKF